MKNSRCNINAIHSYSQLRISFLSTLLVFVFFLFNQVVFGQTGNTTIEQRLEAPPLPSDKGLIICTREVRLLADTKADDFENWVTAYWNEAWHDLIPDIQSFISKNNSVEEGNIYTYHLIFNSKRLHQITLENADKNTEWYREFIYYPPTKKLYEELFEHIEKDSFFNSWNWVEIK